MRRNIVQKGIFSNELLSVIRHAYDLTHECDCEHMPVPSDEDIRSILSATLELMALVETHLRQEDT